MRHRAPFTRIWFPLRWLGLWGSLGVGCEPQQDLFLPTDIHGRVQGGLLTFYGKLATDGEGLCEENADVAGPAEQVLLDVGTPLLVKAGTGLTESQAFPRGLLQLHNTLSNGQAGAARARFCDLPMVESSLTAQDLLMSRTENGRRASTGPLGGVLGGAFLSRAHMQLRLPRSDGRAELRLRQSDVTQSCQVDAAVLPFALLGGDLRVSVGTALITYPPSRVTVAACAEPLADPLTEQERPPQVGASSVACLDSVAMKRADDDVMREIGRLDQAKPEDRSQIVRLESWHELLTCLQDPTCQREANGAELGDLVSTLRLRHPSYEDSGVNLRFLVSTSIPDLLLSESACLRLANPARCRCAEPDRVTLQLPGVSQVDEMGKPIPTPETGCRITLGSAERAALVLIARGTHLSPCAELARSRRQRASLRGTPNLRDEACLENLERQSELLTRRCGYTGREVSQACDDHLAPVQAFVELGGPVAAAGQPPRTDPLEALVVPDGTSVLRATNTDLRNTGAKIDGVLGLSALARLQTGIDFPQQRLTLQCRCDPGAACQAMRGVTYTDVDSCSPAEQPLVPGNLGRLDCRP